MRNKPWRKNTWIKFRYSTHQHTNTWILSLMLWILLLEVIKYGLVGRSHGATERIHLFFRFFCLGYCVSNGIEWIEALERPVAINNDNNTIISRWRHIETQNTAWEHESERENENKIVWSRLLSFEVLHALSLPRATISVCHTTRMGMVLVCSTANQTRYQMSINKLSWRRRRSLTIPFDSKHWDSRAAFELYFIRFCRVFYHFQFSCERVRTVTCVDGRQRVHACESCYAMHTAYSSLPVAPISEYCSGYLHLLFTAPWARVRVCLCAWANNNIKIATTIALATGQPNNSWTRIEQPKYS